MRHFLSAADLTREAALGLFALAAEDKKRRKSGRLSTPLAGKTFALIFEKPSLRTRVTFEVGIIQLGGRAVHLVGRDIGLGTRESVPDVARNLSLWVDGIMARVYSHSTITELARHASVPVVNGLSDREHPCQALADFFTLWERGIDFATMRFAFIGDGNNVCHSLMLLGATAGVTVAAATPPELRPVPEIVSQARAWAELTDDPAEAAAGAHALYTDVWVSMGDEAEGAERRRLLEPYRLDAGLLAKARDDAIVMHCLPAHPGEEITEDVLYGERSAVWDQAENRLHAQKALLELLLA